MSFKRNTRVTGNTISKMSTWDSSAQLWTPLELKTAPSPPTVLSPKEFDNATNWVPTGNITTTANAAANPIDATVDADKLQSTGGTTARNLIQGGLSFVEGFEYTLSVYVKNDNLPTAKNICLTFGTTCFDEDWAIFDIYNGDLVQEYGGSSPSGRSNVTDVGGGWFKYEFSLVANATGTDDVAVGFAGNTSAYRPSHFMTSGQGAFFWNAQVTCRSTLTRWFDPSDSSTLVLSGSDITTITDKINSEVLTSSANPPIIVPNASGSASAIESTNASATLEATNSNVFRNKEKGVIFWMGYLAAGTLPNNCMAVFTSIGTNKYATRLGFSINANNTGYYGTGVRRLDADGFNIPISSQLANREVVFIGQSFMDWFRNKTSMFHNGVETLAPTSPATLTAGYTSDTDSLSFGIPGSTAVAPTAGTRWFDVLCFDNGLPSTIRQKLEGWLAHKGSQSTILDVSHPYKTQPPYIS